MTGGRDGVVRIWDLARGRAFETIEAYYGWALAARPRRMVGMLRAQATTESSRSGMWGKQKRVLIRTPGVLRPQRCRVQP